MVAASAPGLVCAVYLERPQRTAELRHLDRQGTSFYSVYTHLSEVRVKVGESVSPEKLLALTEPSNGPYAPVYSHLHFEIRHTFEGGGIYSYTLKTPDAVLKNFMDPQKLLGL